jgi:uncharacterized membrane-anchored protein YjiN (DUF445 family)
MDADVENKLELAVKRYVDNMSVEELKSRVIEELWYYYSHNAYFDEACEFIEEVGITDEDVTQ